MLSIHLKMLIFRTSSFTPLNIRPLFFSSVTQGHQSQFICLVGGVVGHPTTLRLKEQLIVMLLLLCWAKYNALKKQVCVIWSWLQSRDLSDYFFTVKNFF